MKVFVVAGTLLFLLDVCWSHFIQKVLDSKHNRADIKPAHIPACTHAYTHTTHMHSHTHIHTNRYTPIHMHACTHTHTCARTCTPPQRHMHANMHAWVHPPKCKHSRNLISSLRTILFLVRSFPRGVHSVAAVGKPCTLSMLQHRGTGQAWHQWTPVWWQWAVGTAASGDCSLPLPVLYQCVGPCVLGWCLLSCCC